VVLLTVNLLKYLVVIAGVLGRGVGCPLGLLCTGLFCNGFFQLCPKKKKTTLNYIIFRNVETHQK
jgi:hypothetical protein